MTYQLAGVCVTTSTRVGRLSPRDGPQLAGYGLRARPVRVVLSALGIQKGAAVAAISASGDHGHDSDRDRYRIHSPRTCSPQARASFLGTAWGDRNRAKES
jgi:hypothetical protein